MATTTKQNNQFCTTAPSIDANRRPWDSISAYTTWLTNTIGMDTPMEGTEILVRNASTGELTAYRYEVISGTATWKAADARVSVDSALNTSSTNPVQNKAAAAAIASLRSAVTTLQNAQVSVDSAFDSTSNNPVQNKVVSNAITALQSAVNALRDAEMVIDPSLSTTSTNPVRNSAVTAAINSLRSDLNSMTSDVTTAETAATNAASSSESSAASAQTSAQRATAAASSAAAAQTALESINTSIANLDPSTSTEDAIVALTARVAVSENDITALETEIDEVRELADPPIIISDNIEAVDTTKCEAARAEIKAIYISTPPAANHRYVLSYVYLQTSNNKWYLSIVDYNTSDDTYTSLVSSCELADKTISDIIDPNGNVIGSAYLDSDNYTLIGNAGEGYARLPYLSEIAFDRSKQAIFLSGDAAQALTDSAAALEAVDDINAEFHPTLFGSDNTETSDTVKCAAANAQTDAFYLSVTPASGHRFVLSYLYLQDSNNSWYFTIIDLNVSEGTSTTLVNHCAAVDKTVSVVYDTDGNDIGRVCFDSDHYTYIQNTGEGYARMPYLLASAFDRQSQIDLLKSDVYTAINTAEDASERIGDVETELFPTLFGSDNTEASDTTKCAALNAEVKALYLTVSPASGHRFVFSSLYLQTSDMTWYFNIADLNTSDGTYTMVVNHCRVENKTFDTVTDPSGNEIGFVYFDSDNYTSIENQGEGYARMPYLLDPCFDAMTQTKVFRSYTDSRLTSLETKTTQKSITVWGDSITWGSAASANNLCYASRLQTLITNAGFTHKVINCGVGGDNMPTTVGRMGGTMLYLNRDITIPASASGSVVVDTVANYVQVGRYLKASCKPNGQIQLMMQGDLGRTHIPDEDKDDKRTVNPVLINGVSCVWGWTATTEGQADEGTYTLAVKEDQSADVVVKAGTPIYTHGARLKSDVAVFAMGTNAGFSSADDYINMIDLAIEAVNTKHFIVCSPYGGTALSTFGVSGLETLEEALAARYGAKFFNWRKYLVEEGLTVEGLTATSADTTAIAAGECPPQLLSDVVHPNDYGHDAIAQRLYQMMLALGYFD